VRTQHSRKKMNDVSGRSVSRVALTIDDSLERGKMERAGGGEGKGLANRRGDNHKLNPPPGKRKGVRRNTRRKDPLRLGLHPVSVVEGERSL